MFFYSNVLKILLNSSWTKETPNGAYLVVHKIRPTTQPYKVPYHTVARYQQVLYRIFVIYQQVLYWTSLQQREGFISLCLNWQSIYRADTIAELTTAEQMRDFPRVLRFFCCFFVYRHSSFCVLGFSSKSLGFRQALYMGF